MFQSIIDSIHNKFMKLSALALVACSVLVLLALVSHNSADPSFNNATIAKPTNIIGGFGAYLSDMLLQFFGYASVIISLIFMT